jgi:hypothetical protein
VVEENGIKTDFRGVLTLAPLQSFVAKGFVTENYLGNVLPRSGTRSFPSDSNLPDFVSKLQTF